MIGSGDYSPETGDGKPLSQKQAPHASGRPTVVGGTVTANPGLLGGKQAKDKYSLCACLVVKVQGRVGGWGGPAGIHGCDDPTVARMFWYVKGVG